jgi:hypothetical protein
MSSLIQSSLRTSNLFIPPPSDITPDAFAFHAVTNAEIATNYSSNTVTITGIDVPVSVTISPGSSISINGGGFQNSGTITNGQTLTLRTTSYNGYSQLTTISVMVGSVSVNWDVTTKAQPIVYHLDTAVPATNSGASVSNNILTLYPNPSDQGGFGFCSGLSLSGLPSNAWWYFEGTKVDAGGRNPTMGWAYHNGTAWDFASAGAAMSTVGVRYGLMMQRNAVNNQIRVQRFANGVWQSSSNVAIGVLFTCYPAVSRVSAGASFQVKIHITDTDYMPYPSGTSYAHQTVTRIPV